MRIPLLLILSISLLSPNTTQANIFSDIKKKGEEAAHKVKDKAEDVVDHAKDVAKKALPDKVIKKINDAYEKLNPAKLKKTISGKIKDAEADVLKTVHDPVIEKQLGLIIHDLKFVEKQGKALLKGPCGKEMFTKVMPKWFKQQIGNLKELFDLGKTGAMIGVNFVKHTPDFISLAASLGEISVKVAQKAMDPENRKIIKDASENIEKGIQKFKELPKVIADTTLLIKDVGILIGEGTTCVNTLVTDIVEGVEGVVEGLGGVAACTTGAGCLEELLTVKSIAVGAASTVASDISCAATVANTAENGAKDVMNLVKLLYSYTELIDAVVALKDDVVATVNVLKTLSDDIKEDIPNLEKKLQVVASVVSSAEKDIKKLIPRIRDFATQLVSQLKSNLNFLMYCKSEVAYVFKLAGYTIKDGFTGSVKAAAHVLRADKVAAAIKKQFDTMQDKVEAELRKRIDDIKSRLQDIKSNPIAGVKRIPGILKDIEQIPVTVVRHAIGTAEASIRDSIKVLKHHQEEARKELSDRDDNSPEDGIESIKKPTPVKIEGDHIDAAVKKATAMAKNLGNEADSDDADEA